MKRSRRIWALAAYLVFRWVLLTLPGYVADIGAYKRWTLQAARGGLAHVYANSDMDYPPLYAWILYPLGKLYGWLSPEALAQLGDSTLLTLLIKLPPLLFDLGIAWAVYRFARGGTGQSTAEDRENRLGWALAAAYLLNPAIVFNTGYWGQPDSIHSFFVLSAFLVLGRAALPRPGGLPDQSPPPAGSPRTPPIGVGSAWPAWVLLTLATLMKPLGAPFFPLLLVLSVVLCGLAATAAAMGAAAATVALVFLPFLVSGQASTVFHRVISDVGLMPFTSVNGHNLWWVLGGWRPADVPWIGPVTLTHIGLALFGAVYLGLLWKAHRLHRDQPGGIQPLQAMALAAGVGFSFFMLSTHMHENHMFIVLPLWLPLLTVRGPSARPLRLFFGALSVGVLLNLGLHDPGIPLHWPFTAGGPSSVMSVHMKRPFFVFELASIRFATFWNLACFGVFLLWMFRPRGRGLLEAVGAART